MLVVVSRTASPRSNASLRLPEILLIKLLSPLLLSTKGLFGFLGFKVDNFSSLDIMNDAIPFEFLLPSINEKVLGPLIISCS